MQVTVVMKFGGSSVATAERMREVLDIICTFPEHLPCIVLSAMGKVTVAVLQFSVLIMVILAFHSCLILTKPACRPQIFCCKLDRRHRLAARAKSIFLSP